MLSEDEDCGMELGQVPGPMLDYTRYYPTTLPMHKPRHDSSEASAASDEVRVAQRVPSLGTPSPTWLVRCLSKESSFVHIMATATCSAASVLSSDLYCECGH